MLYGTELPLVSLGLVYKLPHILTILFSAAYMHLNEWHSAVSDKESENRLEEPCLLFVHLFEMSGVLPVVV